MREEKQVFSQDTANVFFEALCSGIGFGMLDIVRYNNSSELRPDHLEHNVAGHADPGLLSLSCTSTSAGLQLYDPTSDTWVDCPLDMGVLWCGSAATRLNESIPAGLHRVVFGDEPRFVERTFLCPKCVLVLQNFNVVRNLCCSSNSCVHKKIRAPN